MTPKSLDVAAGQIKGAREYQEDVYEVITNKDKANHLICLLADGMGGHAAGDVAAQTAIENFHSTMSLDAVPCHNQFMSCIDNSNRAIAKKVEADPSLYGMGCTLVGLEIIGDVCYWISVGDSPLFHFRGGTVTRINADHSMAKQLDAAAKAGEITEQEAMNSPSRNVLLSALTGDTINRLDYSHKAYTLIQDDWLVLASDGVETLSPQQLIEIITSNLTKSAKDVLNVIMKTIGNINKQGQDNASAIVIHIKNALPQKQIEKNINSDEVSTRPIPTNKNN